MSKEALIIQTDWSPARGLPGGGSAAGVAAGGHDGVGDGGQVLAARAGDRVAEPGRQAGSGAGRDLQDRGFAAVQGSCPAARARAAAFQRTWPMGRPLSGLAPVAMNAVVKSARVSQW